MLRISFGVHDGIHVQRRAYIPRLLVREQQVPRLLANSSPLLSACRRVLPTRATRSAESQLGEATALLRSQRWTFAPRRGGTRRQPGDGAYVYISVETLQSGDCSRKGYFRLVRHVHVILANNN